MDAARVAACAAKWGLRCWAGSGACGGRLAWKTGVAWAGEVWCWFRASGVLKDLLHGLQ